MTTAEAPAARSLPDQLRDAIRECGLSVRELGKRSDVDPGQVHRFLAADRSLTLDTADRLASVLGLRLAEGPRRPGRPKSRPRP